MDDQIGKIAIFCVGNKLMLDDGLGPAVYEELVKSYVFPSNVELFDVGCMGLNMIEYVDSCTHMISIDAIDESGHEPGTVLEYSPEDIEAHYGATASLHELTLTDLFESAALLGYSCNGKCFGIQVENASPSVVTIGLTEPVFKAVPLLIDALLAYLCRIGVEVKSIASGLAVEPGYHHEMLGDECL